MITAHGDIGDIWRIRAREKIRELHEEWPESPESSEKCARLLQERVFAPLVYRPGDQAGGPCGSGDVLPLAGRFAFVGANLRAHGVRDGRLSSTMLQSGIAEKVANRKESDHFTDVLLETYFRLFGRENTFVERCLAAWPFIAERPEFVWLGSAAASTYVECSSVISSGVNGLRVLVSEEIRRQLGCAQLFTILTDCVQMSRTNELWVWTRRAVARAEAAGALEVQRNALRDVIDGLLTETAGSLPRVIELTRHLCADERAAQRSREGWTTSLLNTLTAIQTIGIWQELAGSEVILAPVRVRQQGSADASADDELCVLTCIGPETADRAALPGQVAEVAQAYHEFREVIGQVEKTHVPIAVDWVCSFAEHNGYFVDQTRELLNREVRLALFQTVALAQELAGSVHEGHANEYVFFICSGREAGRLVTISEEGHVLVPQSTSNWTDFRREWVRPAADALRTNYAIFRVGGCAAYVDPRLTGEAYAISRMVDQARRPRVGWVIRAGRAGVTVEYYEEDETPHLELRWNVTRGPAGFAPHWTNLKTIAVTIAGILSRGIKRELPGAEEFPRLAADCAVHISDESKLGCLIATVDGLTQYHEKQWLSLLVGARMNWCTRHTLDTLNERVLLAMAVMDGATVVDQKSGDVECAVHFEPRDDSGRMADARNMKQAEAKEIVRSGIGTRRRAAYAIGQSLPSAEAVCVSSDGPIYHANRKHEIRRLHPDGHL